MSEHTHMYVRMGGRVRVRADMYVRIGERVRVRADHINARRGGTEREYLDRRCPQLGRQLRQDFVIIHTQRLGHIAGQVCASPTHGPAPNINSTRHSPNKISQIVSIVCPVVAHLYKKIEPALNFM